MILNGGHVRLDIPPLTEDELLFVLRVLNLRLDNRSISISSTASLDRMAVRMQKKLCRGKLLGATETDDKKTRHIVSDWRDARESLSWVIDNSRSKDGFFLHLPPIGLPARHTTIWIRNPTDLMNWLLARAIGNRQHLRFVKCVRCKKFGLRKRGRKDSVYCSHSCQLAANKEQLATRSETPEHEIVPPPGTLERQRQLSRRAKY